MNYYKERYRAEHHLARYARTPSSASTSPLDRSTQK